MRLYTFFAAMLRQQLFCVWRKRVLPRLRYILVVDDNADGARALVALLGLEGYEARHALSGLAALDIVRHWRPDAIVLDINMPECDGFSTARLLRCIAATREAGLIAFTALSEHEVETKGIASGFDGYAQKGSPEGLLRALRSFQGS